MRFPVFIRLPAPRRRNHHISGRVRRCHRAGHDWRYEIMRCRRCGYCPAPILGSLSASRAPDRKVRWPLWKVRTMMKMNDPGLGQLRAAE
jgi:hypothetical protein